VGFFFTFPQRARAAFRAISRRRSGVSFAARARPPFGPPAFPPREPISRRYSRIVSRPLATKPDSIVQEWHFQCLDTLKQLQAYFQFVSGMRDKLQPAALAPRSLPKRRVRRSTGRRADATVPEEDDSQNTAQKVRGLSARGLEVLLQCLRRYVEANPAKFTTLVEQAGRRRIQMVVLRRPGKRP